MKKKLTFAIYHDYIPRCGGIESAVYNLAKVLKDKFTITICFRSAESYQSLLKYSTVADVIRLDDTRKDQILEFDTCLIASNHTQPKQIQAKRYLQWIHSDYEKYKLKLAQNKIDEYIAVSDHAGRIAKKLFGIKPITIQNILDPDFTVPDMKKVLKLVTNSRVSPEKGFGRMLQFAEGLKKEGIDFQWWVYGDNSHFPKEYWQVMDNFRHIPEVLFVGYRENITYGLAQADYLVQLSDFEGCPYSVLEALKVGVPCILTNFPSASELITHGENGYIVDMKMKDIDYQLIYREIPTGAKLNQENIPKQWEDIINL